MLGKDVFLRTADGCDLLKRLVEAACDDLCFFFFSSLTGEGVLGVGSATIGEGCREHGESAISSNEGRDGVHGESRSVD
jgi:hypothetical protein